MTLLVAWLSRDQNRPSSAYIAADSRISLGRHAWDHGKKVFACKGQPWIFGFCGDVLVPTQIVAQLVDSIDSGLIIDPSAPFPAKWSAIGSFLAEGFAGALPLRSSNPSYILGFNRNVEKEFDCGYFTISDTRIVYTHIAISSKNSVIVKKLGTGEAAYTHTEMQVRMNNADVVAARVFFAAFCRTLRKNEVHSVGGAPQLASLRTAGAGHIVPIKFGTETYHQGIKSIVSNYSGECFDESFQRIDPKTLKLKSKAQRQPLR